MQMESQVLQVNIDDIIPNRFQPRIAFDDQGIKELAASIKEHGIIQPLVLRKLGKKYEIIAGERRYKAATLAGLTSVPAVISNIDDNKSAEIALVENIQRRDLTPIEEARSYKNLLDKGYLTQEDLAKKMGLSQPAIANKLRLLNLDDSIQQALLDGKISERHARSLLVLNNKEDQKLWLDKIINERLTVRQLDQELKKATDGAASNDTTDIPLVDLTPNISDIKNNAIDINPEKKNNVASMLVPETEMTEYSSELPPSEVLSQNNAQSESFSSPEPVNKFFNQLESEPANMNTNNAFSVDSVFDANPVANTSTNNEDIEIFDMPTNNATSESLDKPTSTFHSASEPDIDLNPNNKFFQSIPTTEEVFNQPVNKAEEVINPMSFVETLDDNYTQKQQVEEGTDLNSTISDIRTLVTSLQNKGVNIKIDEADLNDKYQINLIINKNNY
jgi:ParB family transcriptional regulator, chromosome partitioning protein